MTAIPIWIRLAPYVTIGVLIGPVIAGLFGIALPATGIMPLFGQSATSLQPFAVVLAEPGIWTSIWLSFWIGPVSAAIALGLAVTFAAAFSGTRTFSVVFAFFRPVLAIPHAAAAFGLAFLIMPSGFLLRLFSPWATGFERPPDWLIINDPAGFALLAGMVIKETPFLLLVLAGALPQARPQRAEVARALGYGRTMAWLVSVFPSVYAQIRMPVLAVVVFASSVVDMALILGPVTPPTLAVRVLHWMNAPELAQRYAAAAAAVLQLGVTGAALLLWFAGEKLFAMIGRFFALSGRRMRVDHVLRPMVLVATSAAGLAVLAGIALLGLNSVSAVWRFPDAIPQSYTLATWTAQSEGIVAVGWNSLLVGLLSSLAALVLVLLCLENEYRRGRPLSGRALLILYAPLLVPQIGFLPGLTVLFLHLGIDGSLTSVAFAHLVFVLPYTYLVLAAPWNAFDTRYLDIGRALGKSPARVFFQIRLPMLLRPILTALALGFAVSIAQYLPTLLIGGGRLPTITTEAVALASGGNRRLIGVYALIQSILPFIAFAVAALVPAWLWRNRRALCPGAVS